MTSVQAPNSAWMCRLQLKLWPFFVIFFMAALSNRARHIYFHPVICSLLWPPYVIGGHYIFAL